MAQLTTETKDALFADIMRRWSNDRTPTPITKAQGRALIDIMDAGMETAESTILSSIPAGPGRTWLVANASIARKVLELVAAKRQEVL